LINLDIELFRLINGTHCQAMDWVMAFLSDNLCFFVMLVACVLFLSFKEYGKRWWVIIMLIILCFTLADRVSVLCFKDVFCRLRPSHALTDVHTVRLSHFYLLYGNKGGLYGFVSSHAANTFCLTTVLFYLGRKCRIFKAIICFWAFVVCYSRVYCGYHYPGDVLCGAILGFLIGLALLWAYRKTMAYFERVKIKTQK